MINLAALEELLELTIHSGYVQDEQPVSLLITAKPEAGKTELLSQYSQNRGIAYLTDATAWGIQNKYLNDLVEGKIRHIFIPDLVTPLSRKSETVKGFIGFLNAVIEEGVVEIQTYAIQQTLKKPVKCGLVTTITKETLGDQRHGWTKIGFMSRLLPVSYDYAPITVAQIQESIARREYSGKGFKILTLPTEDVAVGIDYEFSKQLMVIASDLVKAEALYGFRTQKHLQRLAMANALRDGRSSVNQGDIDKVRELSRYINLDYKSI